MTPATPPLLHHSSPQVPLPVARIPRPPRYSVAPAKRPACAAPQHSPILPPLHPPNSAQTTSAVATKIKIHQSASAPQESMPTLAKAFPPPNALCTSPIPLFPTQIACRPSSSNLFPAAPTFCQSVPDQKKSAPVPDSSHPVEDH